VPDDTSQVSELYDKVNGYYVPSKWNDLRKTVRSHIDEGADMEYPDGATMEELHDIITDYLEDENVHGLFMRQEHVEEKYPDLADEHIDYVTGLLEEYEEDDAEEEVQEEESPDTEEEVEQQDEAQEHEPVVGTEAQDKLQAVIENSANADDMDDAVDILYGMYEPFTQESVRETLRSIATMLYKQGEIDNPNEQEVTNYAFKVLVVQYKKMMEEAQGESR